MQQQCALSAILEILDDMRAREGGVFREPLLVGVPAQDVSCLPGLLIAQ